MTTKCKIGKTLLLTPFVVLLILTAQAWGQSNLTLGHQMLLEKGLQIKALTRNPPFDVALCKACNFTSIDLGCWYSTYNYDTWAAAGLLPTGDGVALTKPSENECHWLCQCRDWIGVS